MLRSAGIVELKRFESEIVAEISEKVEMLSQLLATMSVKNSFPWYFLGASKNREYRDTLETHIKSLEIELNNTQHVIAMHISAFSRNTFSPRPAAQQISSNFDVHLWNKGNQQRFFKANNIQTIAQLNSITEQQSKASINPQPSFVVGHLLKAQAFLSAQRKAIFRALRRHLINSQKNQTKAIKSESKALLLKRAEKFKFNNAKVFAQLTALKQNLVELQDVHHQASQGLFDLLLWNIKNHKNVPKNKPYLELLSKYSKEIAELEEVANLEEIAQEICLATDSGRVYQA